ncbi:hypothetical protein HYPSUDRAFT_43462 [Hypholoma sublateritium FD-334 SS-4]|uniref:MPN domain-containing protein n=1 Tax=Hypholoma sublateritium (strain FD-334 SS-4) TaxID=945553 RepID=A0A0D2NMS0_HYPSF|nr:hypothetical protein HYPSUDRAFT_43462 [Hypholoma sublateritium FD-334 SS-4]
MASASYTIASEAYYKIFFHAAKHPHTPVNGVLLGTLDASRAEVTISDAVPLLHHWTSLSPMMEIGLDLATQYAESSQLKVVGYYQASERVDEMSLAPVGERVAETLKAKFPDAIAFVIDNQKLGTSQSALIPYFPQPGSSSWRPAQLKPEAYTPGSRIQLASSEAPSEAATYVREQNLHFAFGDFDDHLEDVTIDWLKNRSCLP